MRYIAVFALALLCIPALADSWAAAKPAGVASPSGEIVVRVVPGDSIGDVYGFAGAPKGKFASAVFYRLNQSADYVRYQTVTLLNPVAPLFFAVSDGGELVTLDNWHNMGLGKVVVVYRANGQVLRSYDLKEIYNQAELEKLRTSVSSVWWRCEFPPILEPRAPSLGLYDALGNIVEVALKTGVLSKRPSRGKMC